jgi:hypothetical protein
MDDLLSDVDKIKERVHWYDSHLRMLQNSHDAKLSELEAVRIQLTTLTKAWSDDRERMVQLEQHIYDLKEENAAFSKVSQIIAMEKENARLRNEINLLQKKFHKEVVIEPQHDDEAKVKLCKEPMMPTLASTTDDVEKENDNHEPELEEEEKEESFLFVICYSLIVMGF